MAAPVIVTAAPALVSNAALGTAMVASAKAGLVMFPLIATVAVGTMVAFKVADGIEYLIDRGVDKFMARREGAELNQGQAYKRFRENRRLNQEAARVAHTAPVEVVEVPAPQQA